MPWFEIFLSKEPKKKTSKRGRPKKKKKGKVGRPKKKKGPGRPAGSKDKKKRTRRTKTGIAADKVIERMRKEGYIV